MWQNRQSNMELLRLVCMFFILINHFIIHALPLSDVYAQSAGFWHAFPRVLDAFCVCAVPVFVLISGWFGIKPKIKGFLNFYIQCAFYFGLLYCIYLFVIGSHINRWCILNTVFPFTYNPDLWFVECYALLYIISPILNRLVSVLTKKEYALALLLLTFVQLYFGWYRQHPCSDMNGYNVYNFAYLYLIGRFLSLHICWDKISNLRVKSLLGFVVGSFGLGILPILNSKLCLLPEWSPLFHFYLYNHPLLLVNSILLLLLFTTFHFQSRWINRIAASTLAIYILHENEYFRDYIYSFVAGAYTSSIHPAMAYLYWVFIALAIMAVSICIDSLRQLICNPIVEKLNMLAFKIVDSIRIKIDNYKL